MIYCIYDGVSQFDSSIEVLSFLYTKPTSNQKLGNKVHYTVTVPKHGEIQNKGTCNNCSLLKNGCYVNGYMSISYYRWIRQYNEGLIPFLDVQSPEGIKLLKRHSKGFKLRFNVTGDPLAIPYEINQALINAYDSHIMYSHFRFMDSRYENICLQSTEKYIRKRKTARILPFTVKDLEQNKKEVMSYIGHDEVICPAQTKEISCTQCMLCETRRKSIVFLAHGNGNKKIINNIPEMEF